MKWLGMVFIISAACYAGLSLARELNHNCRVIRQLTSSLQILKSELHFCASALPQAFAVAAAGSEGVVQTLWITMSNEMQKHRWLPAADCMQRTLTKLPQLEKLGVSDLLKNLCAGLGSYDLQYQLQSLERAIAAVQRLEQSNEYDRKGKSKMYRTLGFSAGLALVILLI